MFALAIKEPPKPCLAGGSVIRVTARRRIVASSRHGVNPSLAKMATKTGSATSSSAVSVIYLRQRATMSASGESCGRPRDRATGMAVLDRVCPKMPGKVTTNGPAIKLRRGGRWDNCTNLVNQSVCMRLIRSDSDANLTPTPIRRGRSFLALLSNYLS